MTIVIADLIDSNIGAFARAVVPQRELVAGNIPNANTFGLKYICDSPHVVLYTEKAEVVRVESIFICAGEVIALVRRAKEDMLRRLIRGNRRTSCICESAEYITRRRHVHRRCCAKKRERSIARRTVCEMSFDRRHGGKLVRKSSIAKKTKDPLLAGDCSSKENVGTQTFPSAVQTYISFIYERHWKRLPSHYPWLA